jgi:exo-1,4-beta-D-glucosaminidase
VLDWDNSDWYYTLVTKYSDFIALNKLTSANVSVGLTKTEPGLTEVTLESTSGVPAFFVSLSLVDAKGADVLPLTWSDNYVTLWPKEKLSLTASVLGGGEPSAVQVVGKKCGQVDGTAFG